MSSFVELLGETLVGKAGDVKTADAVANKTTIALYFSAHWCPPCQAFTPVLAKQYESALQGKGMEIVFVSSDKDDEKFKDYYNDMPWLALPFADRERKAELSKKYKVKGIPTLVILGPDGNLITADGRSKIDDLEGYPWAPKPFSELIGDSFVGQNGPVGKEAVANKVLGLYFSAHWCPPCRGFTPQLVDTYNKVVKKHSNFEIVFLSSDRDEDAFKGYFKEMPWLALPYEKRNEKEELSTLFEVNGIPSLIIMDADGSVINKNARGMVGGDPEGDNFPWAPKLVNDIAVSCDNIDELPSLIVFADDLDKEEQQKKEDDLTTVAAEVRAAAKAKGDEDEIAFFIARSADKGPVGRIRELCKIENGSNVKCILLDIPSDGAFYEFQGHFSGADNIRDFLQQFRDKKLERKQLGN